MNVPWAYSAASLGRLKRSLTAGLAALLLVAVGMAAWLAWPRPARTPPEVDLESPSRDKVRPVSRHSLTDLAVIWQRDLRQPVVDRPQESPERPPEPKLAIQLVGTAVEAERCYGFFRLADTTTTVKAVGEVVDGFEIVAIERGRARLRNGDRGYELKVPRYDQLEMARRD
jgi:hypothetical protein